MLNGAVDGWQITIVPPLGAFPAIRFADDVDTLDDAARDAVLLSAWAARRWNIAGAGGAGPAGRRHAGQTRA